MYSIGTQFSDLKRVCLVAKAINSINMTSLIIAWLYFRKIIAMKHNLNLEWMLAGSNMEYGRVCGRGKHADIVTGVGTLKIMKILGKLGEHN